MTPAPQAPHYKPCPSCHTDNPGAPFCWQCGFLPEMREGVNDFEVLKLKPRFQLDEKTLQAAFHEANRNLHPDRFVTRPAEERDHSLSWSAMANSAWRRLRDPIERAHHLLGLFGAELDTEEKKKIPTALAEEYFEMQEALEEGDTGALDGLKERLATLLAGLDGELTQLYARADEGLDAGQAPLETLKSIAEKLHQRSYLVSMTRDIGRRAGVPNPA